MNVWLNLPALALGLLVSATASAAPADGQALEELARQYWAAEVRQDWSAVYEMLAPEGRGSGSPDEYAADRKEVGPLHFKEARVGQASLQGEIAWVHVNFVFTLPRQPWAGSKAGQTWQLWQYTDRWRPVPPAQREEWPSLPPQLRPGADEAALAKRTAEYWQARVAQDWRSVYQYLSPEYRVEVPVERFLQSKAKNLYFAPSVTWAEVKGSTGRVKVAYRYKYADPAATKMEPLSGGAIENWIKADGNWYLDIAPPPPAEEQKSEKTS